VILKQRLEDKVKKGFFYDEGGQVWFNGVKIGHPYPHPPIPKLEVKPKVSFGAGDEPINYSPPKKPKIKVTPKLFNFTLPEGCNGEFVQSDGQGALMWSTSTIAADKKMDGYGQHQDVPSREVDKLTSRITELQAEVDRLRLQKMDKPSECKELIMAEQYIDDYLKIRSQLKQSTFARHQKIKKKLERIKSVNDEVWATSRSRIVIPIVLSIIICAITALLV